MNQKQSEFFPQMVQEIGEAISIARKLRKSSHIVEADETLSHALITILPEQADFIEMLDEAAVLPLLGDYRVSEMYVKLLLERASIKFALDLENKANYLQHRAIRTLMFNLDRYHELTNDGLLLWGLVSGLELQLLLTQTEYEKWQRLDRYIQDGTIRLSQ